MNIKLAALALAPILALAFGAGHLSPAQRPGPEAVAKVLDNLHDAASKADGPRYFGCFAPSGIFIGTDATERWTVDEFKKYAQARFDKGQGWTYTPRAGDRHIEIGPDGSVAWFDEMLDNQKYGLCRGSGVLVRTNDVWQIAQYNLSVPVPNDLLPAVVEMIRKQPTK